MKVLIANRGEIACRIARTLRAQGVASVAVHSDVDAEAPHVTLCDQAVGLGEPRAYLDIHKLLAAARATAATHVHPGYGFLSQSPTFARACAEAGLRFLGPSPEAMAALGDKRSSRRVAEEAGVPVIPGASRCDSVADAKNAAAEVGYPVLLKAAGGGGGKGMRRVGSEAELAEAFAAARREAKAGFDDDRLLVEKYVFPARHVEVQILGDGKDAVALGERECSLQRRYQKVLEESPSPGISDETRRALLGSAVALARAVGYQSAGTVEFLVGPDGKHYFLEVNTRLQVEHPVTELVSGLDIVRLQLDLDAGGSLPEAPRPRGHAIEARLNAEDAYGGFLPATGTIVGCEFPHAPGVRVDTGVRQGSVVTPHYDPMLAKIIAWGETREQARRRLIGALEETVVLGVVTNQRFLIELLERDFFVSGATYTSTLEEQRFVAPEVPAYARALAARELEKPAVAPTTAGGGDAHSPWTTLGPLRLP